MIALIDADILCYIASIVSESEVVWDEGDDPHHIVNGVAAEQVIRDAIKQWTKAAKCKRHVIVLSDRTHKHATFRYGVHPFYKGQRAGDKPQLHDDMVELLKENYTTISYPGLEGDDVMGLLATGEDGGKYVVVSIDKDMMTVPCRQFNPDVDKAVRKVSQHAADYNWMLQTLIGDTVDNYKGAWGIGEKTAKPVLAPGSSLGEWWGIVLRQFATQFDDPRWGKKFICENAYDEALMNARCARILRHGDYNFRTNQVRLWTPDGEEIWVDAQQPKRTEDEHDTDE